MNNTTVLADPAAIENIVRTPVFERRGVYIAKDHGDFDYSDGIDVEDYILNVIRGAQDVSSGSRELEGHIRDWPSLYHLSRERTLAYQSLKIPASARVLEVGSGCGSVTRYLGERAHLVVALEGSPRRAAITCARTRDLAGVVVLCASFQDVEFMQQFDIVVCNGVLEYAAQFVDGPEPHRRMLRMLSALVAPGGSLVVAIENQFGLRYFSSAKEEHTNIMFDGLEGYASQPGGARTFGWRELHGLLQGEFSTVETLLPLPDYKLPHAVVRAELPEKVNCAELFANTTRHDFGGHVLPRIHERLAWHEVQRNSMMRELANSFFMVATKGPSTLLEPEWMGDIYSIRRDPSVAVRTRIAVAGDGSVFASKSKLRPDAPKLEMRPLDHRVETTKWSNGTSIHTEVVRALRRRGHIGVEDRLRTPILAWWNAVNEWASPDGRISGEVLDYNWQNTLFADSTIEFIDNEWVWKDSIDTGWLIYRVVALFAGEEVYYAHRWARPCRGLSPYRLMKTVAEIAGVDVTLVDLIRGAAQESAFKKAVTGKKSSRWRLVILMFEPINLRQRRFLARRAYRRLLSKVLRQPRRSVKHD